MALTYSPKALFAGALTVPIATLYTCPSSTTSIVKEILICNSDSRAQTFTIYLVPNGQSVGQAYRIAYLQPVDGNSTQILSLSTVMQTGDTIQALCSAGSLLSARISGVEGT